MRLLGTCACFLVLIFGCAQFGEAPSGQLLAKISLSPNFDKNRNAFVNRQVELTDELRAKRHLWSFTKDFFWGKEKDRSPKTKLPELKPNIEAFLKSSQNLKFVWLGHSTFLVNINGKILLFDPIFSRNASPITFIGTRFQPPAMQLEELPSVDYIIISHDHYDHLDMKTIKFFVDKSAHFLVPLGVSSHLLKWGISGARITELDWWQSFKSGSLEFINTPAQHFSGRTGSDSNITLWSSWVVKSSSQSMFYSGDTGYDKHFKEIGDKHGPIDLVFLENGQYNKMWKAIHMSPEETAQACVDLKGKHLVPVHWGMFNLALHNWYDPPEQIERHSQNRKFKLLTPMLGQMVELNKQQTLKKWWKPWIPKL